MRFKLYHPKLLVVVVLALAVTTAAGLLLASGGDDFDIEVVNVPVENPKVALSEELIQEAVTLVKTAGVVEFISDRQDWTFENATRAKVDGTEAVRFDAVWEEPVVSDGPWFVIQCQGTRKLMIPARWTNVTRLEFIVDVEHDEVVAYLPVGEYDESAPVVDLDAMKEAGSKVYDVASGDLVFEGKVSELPTKDIMCPEDKQDPGPQ